MTYAPRLARMTEKHRPFLYILGIIVVVKITLLITSQRYADGDESVVGVMALHILRNGERPFYYWGQSYGGGGAIEAYLAALLFRAFGVSTIALKSVALAFGIGAVVCCYAAVRSAVSERAGILAALFFAFSSAVVKLFTQLGAGYVETPFFMFLIAYLITRLRHAQRPSVVLCGVGLVSGVGYYNQEQLLPFLACAGLYLVLVERSSLTIRSVALGALGLLVGLSPCLVYNFQNNLANFHEIAGATAFVPFADQSLDGITRLFPAVFFPENFNVYPGPLPARTLLEAGLFLGIALSRLLAKGFWRTGRSIEWLWGGYLVIELIWLLLNERTRVYPRYFLPLLPPMAVLLGVALSAGSLSLRLSLRRASVGLIGVVLGLGLYSHATMFGDNTVFDFVGTSPGRQENLKVAGDDMVKAVAFLQERGIDAVRSPYFSQWRMIWESEEAILASASNLSPSKGRMDSFDEWVARSPRVAYVFHRDSVDSREMAGNASFDKTAIGAYNIYVPN